MSSQTVMSLLNVAEFALWATLGLLFWTKKLQRRFPAMGGYLALHVTATPVLVLLFYGQANHWFNDYCFVVYFFVYWAVFIASAVILYFVCTEVFRSALSAFPGLMKFGLVVFRWAAFASVIVSFSTLSFSHRGILVIPDIAYALMRSVSILELCLLGFLCLSMNTLRLPARDMAFGISLGFGVMVANEFVQSMMVTSHTSLTAPWQFVYESVILVSVGTWTVFCALPEPARHPVVMPANSTIYRWNEIASALGHTGTQVAVQQPSNGFFLTDVERVVEKVLARNLKDRESES
jgi:hypothetical protein